MGFQFKTATRSQQKLRAAIDGPSGAGKTFSALRMGFALIDAGLGTRLAVIDTENGSASLYAGESPDGKPWQFDTLTLEQFNPDQYSAAIEAAEKAGYDVIVIDSLSHAWVGKGGALEIVDSKGGNKFTAWKDVTPLHRKMTDAIIRSKAHVIVTMRSKTEYVLEEDDKGKKVPRKIGVAPVQREGMEYEFDVYGSVDWSHQIKISKSRCPSLQDATGVKPGPAFWQPLFDWLKTAKPAPDASPAQTVPDEPPTKTEPTPSANGTPVRVTRFDLIKLIGSVVNQEQFDAAQAACSKARKDGHITDDDVKHLVPQLKRRKEQLIPATATVPAGGTAEPNSKS